MNAGALTCTVTSNVSPRFGLGSGAKFVPKHLTQLFADFKLKDGRNRTGFKCHLCKYQA